MKNKLIYFLSSISLITLLVSCGGKSEKKYVENPVNTLIKELDKEPVYAVILADMKVKEGWNDEFLHQYKIIRQRNGMPTESKLNWRQVPKDFFWQNEANLGMELVSKDSAGKINRVASPPGYGSYIGNKKYGSWQRDNNGNQFWQFFGQYMFMRSMFGMFSTPIYYNNYHNYRSNYYGRRPYYGSYGNSGQRRWGTTSSNSRRSNSNFFDRRKTSRSNSSTKRSSRRGGGGWGK